MKSRTAVGVALIVIGGLWYWQGHQPPKADVRNATYSIEGEPMTLDMRTWTWVKTSYNDGTTIIPKKTDKFKLTFRSDGTFSASTDCNGVGGEYKTDGKYTITFTRMMSTLMYCEGSQEGDFAKGLEQTQSFLFTTKGELVLEFKVDSGTMTFR